MVVLSLYKKTQIGYTQYVDNDVYVDDVDDDEAGAGAYFCSDKAMLTSTVNYIECQGQAYDRGACRNWCCLPGQP